MSKGISKYPSIHGAYKKPDATNDGRDNYGKPCAICGTSTRGQKWIRVSYMRGEDETVYICAKHWGAPADTILAAYLAEEINT